MAYDDKLAERIRNLLKLETGLSEMKMFGGLAFLINGNMTIAASGQGGIMVRVDPTESQKILQSTKAQSMVMRGSSMSGWLRVDGKDVGDDTNLRRNEVSSKVWYKIHN
jgi:hypothetical protein